MLQTIAAEIKEMLLKQPWISTLTWIDWLLRWWQLPCLTFPFPIRNYSTCKLLLKGSGFFGQRKFDCHTKLVVQNYRSSFKTFNIGAGKQGYHPSDYWSKKAIHKTPSRFVGYVIGHALWGYGRSHGHGAINWWNYHPFRCGTRNYGQCVIVCPISAGQASRNSAKAVWSKKLQSKPLEPVQQIKGIRLYQTIIEEKHADVSLLHGLRTANVWKTIPLKIFTFAKAPSLEFRFTNCTESWILEKSRSI